MKKSMMILLILGYFVLTTALAGTAIAKEIVI